jgi:SAM-dependent methyltransferase
LTAGGGAVLLTVTKLLPHGRAVGIDLWKTANQSGNALEVTKRNAELEGVADRVDLQTADVRSLPFEDESLDLVLSSLAIHNITDAQGRAKAIDEAVRLLRRGGRLLIVDIGATAEHVAHLRARLAGRRHAPLARAAVLVRQPVGRGDVGCRAEAGLGRRVLCDFETREGLRKWDALFTPSARRVVRADLNGEIVGVEAHLREDAGDVRLRDLRWQTIVIRAEAFANVEKSRCR